MSERVYAATVAEIEPHGLERIPDRERHGRPFDVFSLWFAANAETAVFAVGILTIALYGTSFRGAVCGIVIGNVLAYAIVAAVSNLGPRFGRPQMVISRRAFGRDGNELPAVLAFFAGVGWFAISSVLGSQALAALLHIGYLPALGIALTTQIAIAIYGHNMIHLFEKFAGIILTVGFTIISVAIFSRAHLDAPFDAHAPIAAGGELAGIIYSAALSFSYAVGWAPSASDYSRYLPAATSQRALFGWTFLGGFLPSTALEIAGAAAVTAAPTLGLAAATPAQLITLLFGSGAFAMLGLLTVVFGTISANCLNLYSGAMSALVAWDAQRRTPLAIGLGILFAALSTSVLLLARNDDADGALITPPLIVAAAIGIGVLTTLIVRFTLLRWQAALGIGILGGALALVGTHPERTAHLYTNFLLLLSTWAAPWAGALLASRGTSLDARWAPGCIGWIAGLAVSVLLSQQDWFVGPLAAHVPGGGDWSYFSGFVIAFGVTWLLSRTTSQPVAPLASEAA